MHHHTADLKQAQVAMTMVRVDNLDIRRSVVTRHIRNNRPLTRAKAPHTTTPSLLMVMHKLILADPVDLVDRRAKRVLVRRY